MTIRVMQKRLDAINPKTNRKRQFTFEALAERASDEELEGVLISAGYQPPFSDDLLIQIIRFGDKMTEDPIRLLNAQ